MIPLLNYYFLIYKIKLLCIELYFLAKQNLSSESDDDADGHIMMVFGKSKVKYI